MLEQTNSSIRVASTLIPLEGFNVLLPNACIEEVFMAEQIESIKQSPDWCIGSSNYKGNNILIISLERIEKPASLLNVNTKIIIKIKKPLGYSDSADFGFLAQKVPHIVQANNYSLDLVYNPKSPHQLALSYVNIKDKQAFIPDLKKIITDYLNQC